MVQSKIKVKENDENGVGPSKRASTAEVDHWAFLVFPHFLEFNNYIILI